MLEKQIQYYDEMTRIEVASRFKQLIQLDETEGLTKMRKKLEVFGVDKEPHRMA